MSKDMEENLREKQVKKFEYWLPNEKGDKISYESFSNSLIIIGANGSGKSKLGAWLEAQDPEGTHRIGAQRSLNFDPNIKLTNYDAAQNRIFYGTDHEDFINNHDKWYRWDGKEFNTTKLLDDFELVLSALIALYNNEAVNYLENSKDAEILNVPKQNTPITVKNILLNIWNGIFTERKLIIEDSKIFALSNKNNDETEKYSANQMSDGERSVLYLASQVLTIPKNKTIIIDEPELHLHSSIMNKLWENLEKYRNDCVFIYITHDTTFAASHKNSEKIWIKEYDGFNWELQKIEGDILPKKLLLDILGARKDVLFVEGEIGSLDYQLYTLIYPHYLIIPCGSCSQVINKTKAFNSSKDIHDFNVYGLIDRDFRTDYEIDKLKKDNIYVLKVAEVENLFIVEELIRFMSRHMSVDENITFCEVKDYIIGNRFSKQIDSQVSKRIVSEIKYKLTTTEISDKNIKDDLNNVMQDIDLEYLTNIISQNYNGLLEEYNYTEIIKVFNEKNISKSIGRFFNIENNRYCSLIISLLQNKKNEDILESLKEYFPKEIPFS